MKQIPLTRGHVALVDDADYETMSQHKWQVCVGQRGNVYAVRSITVSPGKQRTVYMHQRIMRPEPGYFVDHIDGNGLNNQRGNLRVCTHKQNCANRRPSHGKSSLFKGVSWVTRKQVWRAHIYVDGTTRWLGDYHSETDAARAYNRAATELYGEFALPNDVPSPAHCSTAIGR